MQLAVIRTLVKLNETHQAFELAPAFVNCWFTVFQRLSVASVLDFQGGCLYCPCGWLGLASQLIASLLIRHQTIV